MLKCFHFSLQRPSVPAFIQQRAKLLPEAMAFVFSEVVRAFPCGPSVDGCRLIACDGSDLHYAVNPNEPENYFVVSEQARGYNLLHLNALYDLDSRRYIWTAGVISTRSFSPVVRSMKSMLSLP